MNCVQMTPEVIFCQKATITYLAIELSMSLMISYVQLVLVQIDKAGGTIITPKIMRWNPPLVRWSIGQ